MCVCVCSCNIYIPVGLILGIGSINDETFLRNLATRDEYALIQPSALELQQGHRHVLAISLGKYFIFEFLERLLIISSRIILILISIIIKVSISGSGSSSRSIVLISITVVVIIMIIISSRNNSSNCCYCYCFCY